MEDKELTYAVIPSAGLGSRMPTAGGTKKNYLPLAGLPVLAHTLRAFEDSAMIDGIVVAVTPEDVGFVTEEIVSHNGFSKVTSVIPGGAERQDSVRLALEVLKKLDPAPETIVVHDGARPLVTPAMIEATVEKASTRGAAIATVRPKDTIKEVADDGTVIRTVPREDLRLVQTPQAFMASLLFQAFDKAEKDGFRGTDESSLVERIGIRVATVDGSYENIKITTQEDLLLAEGILKKRVGA